MSRRVSLVTALIMAVGFVYAARATAVGYAAMMTSPFVAHDSSSIDTFLRPARITSSQLRRGVKTAGWQSGDEVFVLPASDAMSREDVYQVYYSAGYLLYPMPVRLAAHPANPTRPCRVLVFGGANPLEGGQVIQLNESTALVTLP